MAAALDRRGGGLGDLPSRLAADDRLPLDADRLRTVLGDPLAVVGDAPRQVRAFVAAVSDIAAADPAAASYTPEPVL